MTSRDPDDTRVVEHEREVQARERGGGYTPPPREGYTPPHSHQAGDVPPAERHDAGGQVNVNTARGGAAVAAPGPLYYARRVVVLLFSILEVLIALRIVLLALAANPGNALVAFIYSVTEPFIAPFRGIFAIDQVSPGAGSIFDVGALVALVGWVLIELLILAILSIADRNRAYA